MKLKTVALALASACMLGAASSQAAVVSYLDTYDQLGTKMGQDGLFFVRNAGSSAHGDPSVKRGWALYAWDTRGRGWKMLNKQDLMDLGGINFNELLTKKMYSADIGPFKTKVNTFGEQISQCVLGLAELKADDIIIKGQIEALDAKIGSYNGPITNLTDRVVTLENGQAVLVASVDELSAGMAALKGRVTFVEGQVTSLSNAVVAVDGKIPLAMVEAKTYTDVTVSDLKIDMITNTAKRVNAAIETAKTYTDGQIDIERTRADQSAQSKVDAKANEIMGNVNDKLGDLGGNDNVTDFVNVKALGIIETAATDATAKSNQAKADAVAEAKAAVPAIFDEKIVPVKAELEGEISAVDAKIVATSNALDSAATVKASSAKAEANGYTDDKITNLRSVMTSAGGEAMIFNETSGGGSMYTHVDGTISYVGVNNGGADGKGVVLYNKKSDGNGVRINITTGKAYYYKGANKSADQLSDSDEIAVKGELDKVANDAAAALANAFNLPITFTKGDVKYQLDIVDNGADDITLKVIRVED